jgi:hypothetical protein
MFGTCPKSNLHQKQLWLSTRAPVEGASSDDLTLPDGISPANFNLSSDHEKVRWLWNFLQRIEHVNFFICRAQIMFAS